jgi:chromosome segregation ATPase
MNPELPKKQEDYVKILREFLGNIGVFLHLRKIYLQQIMENIGKEEISEKEIRGVPYINIIKQIELMKFENPWLRIVEDYFIKMRERYEKFKEDINFKKLTRKEIEELRKEYKEDIKKLKEELKEKLKDKFKELNEELNENSIVLIVNLVEKRIK